MENKLRLLLADDDSDDRDFFAEVLKELAPTVELTMVSDGKKAVEYLIRTGAEHLPCAIILDYNMPVMGAPEVLDWLQTRSWYGNIRKFVWSTSNNSEYRDRCMHLGALRYFLKPSTQEGLEDLMHQILEYCELVED